MNFYTKQWQTVKTKLILAVKEFFHTSKLLKSFSCTAVTLIPKVINSIVVTYYRTIACCNRIYKIITKILTNKMKGFINIIIISFQSAFIKGRSIIDNILFSHELLK